MTLINECFVTYYSLLQIKDFLSLKANLSQKWLDKLELIVREALRYRLLAKQRNDALIWPKFNCHKK